MASFLVQVAFLFQPRVNSIGQHLHSIHDRSYYLSCSIAGVRVETSFIFNKRANIIYSTGNMSNQVE